MKLQTFISIIFLIISSTTPLLSQNILNITEESDSYTFTSDFLNIFEDKDKSLTIEQISSPDFQNNFKKCSGDIPNLGYTTSGHWFRFKIQNRTDKQKDWLLKLDYPLFDKVILYIKKNETGFIEKKSGRIHSTDKKEIDHRNSIFEINFKPESIHDFYLYVDSGDSMIVPLILLSKIKYAKVEINQRLILGILIGFLIIIMFYNTLIYLMSKDKNYIYLVTYIFAFLFYIICENGIGYEYIWSSFTWLSINSVPIGVSLVIITSSVFFQKFLGTKKNVPLYDKIILIFRLIALAIIIILLIFTNISKDFYFPIILFTVSLTGIYGSLLIFTAIQCLRMKNRAAQFFLVSWIFLIIGAFLYILKAMAIIPNSFIAQNGVTIGGALQLVLLSLGLADKIKTMNIEVIKLKNNLQERAQYLEGIMDNAKISSNELFNVSSEQDQIAGSFTEISMEQAALSEELSASFEELSSSIEPIIESINRQENEKNKVDTMVGELDNTQAYIKEMNKDVLTSIKDIKKTTDQTSKSIDEMMKTMNVINEGGKTISNFLSVIDDISDQINLLSLNASIEAARAGDHGRGFAVVADEIGKLASQTSDNSKFISEQVVKITDDIENASNVMSDTQTSSSGIFDLVSAISTKVDNVTNTIENLGKIIMAIKDQSIILDEVSDIVITSTEDQRKSLDENMKTIMRLSDMAQVIAESSNKITEFTQIISSKASELKNIVKK